MIDDLSQKITPRQLKNAIFLKLEEFLNITPKDRNKFVFIYREKDKNKIHQKLLNKKTELEMGLHNKEKQLYERQISASSYQPTPVSYTHLDVYKRQDLYLASIESLAITLLSPSCINTNSLSLILKIPFLQ